MSTSVSRPHAARTPNDPPALTRASDNPPARVDQQYQSLPEVSAVGDPAIQRRVINGLYHTSNNARLLNTFRLLIGATYEASHLGSYCPVARQPGEAISFLSLRPVHQAKVLDAFDAMPEPQHADNLVTMMASYGQGALIGMTLLDPYINIACKVGVWRTVSEPEVFRSTWSRYANVRLEGLVRLVNHPGFARLTDVNDQLNLLWIFEMTGTGSYRSLRSLLDEPPHRFDAPCWRQMPSDISMPIVSLDFTANSTGNRLIDHLHDLARANTYASQEVIPGAFLRMADHGYEVEIDPASEVEREAAKMRVLGRLIDEVADPDAAHTQGDVGTCPFTSLLNRLAHIRPAEYARLAKSLMFDGAVTCDWHKNPASQFYFNEFAPAVPPLAGNWLATRHDYRQGATQITLPPGRGWDIGSGRSITGRVLQQSFAHFVNSRYGHPNATGLPVLDAMILGTSLLGAQKGFRYCDRVRDITTVFNPSIESVCRATVDPDWLPELERFLAQRGHIAFAGFLWRAHVRPTLGIYTTQCADRNRDPARFGPQLADYHLVQLRYVRRIPRPNGTPEVRIYFWNPWGMRQLDDLARRGHEDADGSVDHAEPVEIDTTQTLAPGDTRGVPDGLDSHIVQERRTSRGMMWVTASEFARNLDAFGYLDPEKGTPIMSLAGLPDPTSSATGS